MLNSDVIGTISPINKAKRPTPKEEKAMTTTELTATVRNLKGLMSMREELEAEITAAQDQIKAEMDAQGVEEMRADVFKVRWTRVISNRFDTAAFKKAHGDIYNSISKSLLSLFYSCNLTI
jgi:predicted phage-related endonuclease